MSLVLITREHDLDGLNFSEFGINGGESFFGNFMSEIADVEVVHNVHHLRSVGTDYVTYSEGNYFFRGDINLLYLALIELLFQLV